MNVFYVSDIPWFDFMANGMIWVIAAALLALIIWIGYDVVTGPRKQAAELQRLLDGLDTSVASISSHKASGNRLRTTPKPDPVVTVPAMAQIEVTETRSKSPFHPSNRRSGGKGNGNGKNKQVKNDLTAKS